MTYRTTLIAGAAGGLLAALFFAALVSAHCGDRTACHPAHFASIEGRR